MTQSILPSHSGNVYIAVVPKENGHYACELTLSLGGRTEPTKSFHGQNPDHAIANALEELADAFRTQAEADQALVWDAVDQSTSGQPIEKRFHVILHYERVALEESKFEALTNTLMGNTVVENAEVSIIKVDSDLPIEPLHKRRTEA